MKQSLKKNQVQALLESSQVFKTQAFKIKFKVQPSLKDRLPALNASQVAFVFSRHAGLSVERHRFKRRLRELIRQHVLKSQVHFLISPLKKLSLITPLDWQKEKGRLISFFKSLS